MTSPLTRARRLQLEPCLMLVLHFSLPKSLRKAIGKQHLERGDSVHFVRDIVAMSLQ